MVKPATLLIGVLLALFIVLSLNDALLTLLGLRLGLAAEGNPLASVPTKAASIAILLIGVGVLSAMYQKRIGVALLLAGFCLFYASVILWNLWMVSLP